MATCLDVITHAMKLTRILPSGGAPSAAEAADGLACLQSLYDQWRTGGMFGTLQDVYLTEDATAQEGKRYYVPAGITLTAATSEYVPDQSSTDYGMCDYSGSADLRQPRDLALYETLTSTGTHEAKLYDRTSWVNLMGLASSDTAPLSSRNAHGLAACLATSGAFMAMFGVQPDPSLIALARHFLRSVMGKLGSTQDKPSGEYY